MRTSLAVASVGEELHIPDEHRCEKKTEDPEDVNDTSLIGRVPPSARAGEVPT